MQLGNIISINGIPSFIQSKKFICKYAAAIAFGGLPTKVPKPPILALYATPKSTNTKVLRSLSILRLDRIPSAKGSIIAAVAVLLIHIERRAVTQKSRIIAKLILPFAR